MAHYGRLRDYRFSGDVDDIRGSSLYGVDDEKLGKIDDVIFDHSTGTIQYAVVDSGGWLSSKKFLVSADRIRPDTKHEDDFYADMTKQQIEALPRYDEDKFNKAGEEGDREWSNYDERYRKSLETTGDVLHRWTNGRFLSTPHRAFNTSGGPRYAIPYFFHPNPDTLIDVLPGCDAEPPRFPAMTTGEYMAWFRNQNYDHVRKANAA